PFTLTIATRRIIYVDPLASGTIDGTTWAQAFRTLGDAFVNWSAGAEIWVTKKADLTIDTSLVLQEGMKVYGGFLGNEVSLHQRPASTQTVLRSSSAGAGYFFDQTTTTLTRLTLLDGFSFNSGRTQNAIKLVSSSPTIRNCTFTKFLRAPIANDHSAPLIDH